ncbi:GNAT family N-acetyltransferase [Sphingomonas aracearum]|uniref:GNAT family N-acetyltransferase n=1 Tax=Sphingomonas aracearum TaxID=2283317 RepID=A0A369VTM9_9SPHN|nr:GNAT family N-acetyltransferase [Sphingomonas aracearum]RDE05738.1 GNAT family N-acetyltransferase [Sphingomonas aracearum]
MSTVDLRAGNAADLGAVDAIMGEAFDPRFGEGWTRNQCLGILAMPGVWLTLALIGEEPAGFALSRQMADEAELLLLATHPAFRRRGVGAALLRSVLHEAEGRGCRMIHLEVREGNEAIRLYQGAGFAKVGQRPSYYRGNAGRSWDAYTFRRDLS